MGILSWLSVIPTRHGIAIYNQIDMLNFTAMFGPKTMLKGTKEIFESKSVIMSETKMCSINLEVTQVIDIFVHVYSGHKGSLSIIKYNDCR